MREMIGAGIYRLFRRALRLFFSVRVPASQIRQHDLWQERNLVCERIRDSVNQTSALMNKLALLDREIVKQHAETTRLEKTRDGLRMPSPTQPIRDI